MKRRWKEFQAKGKKAERVEERKKDTEKGQESESRKPAEPHKPMKKKEEKKEERKEEKTEELPLLANFMHGVKVFLLGCVLSLSLSPPYFLTTSCSLPLTALLIDAPYQHLPA